MSVRRGVTRRPPAGAGGRAGVAGPLTRRPTDSDTVDHPRCPRHAWPRARQRGRVPVGVDARVGGRPPARSPPVLLDGVARRARRAPGAAVRLVDPLVPCRVAADRREFTRRFGVGRECRRPAVGGDGRRLAAVRRAAGDRGRQSDRRRGRGRRGRRRGARDDVAPGRRRRWCRGRRGDGVARCLGTATGHAGGARGGDGRAPDRRAGVAPRVAVGSERPLPGRGGPRAGCRLGNRLGGRAARRPDCSRRRSDAPGGGVSRRRPDDGVGDHKTRADRCPRRSRVPASRQAAHAPRPTVAVHTRSPGVTTPLPVTAAVDRPQLSLDGARLGLDWTTRTEPPFGYSYADYQF